MIFVRIFYIRTKMNIRATKNVNLGRHLVCDMWGVKDIPNDGKTIVALLKKAADIAGATSLESTYHEFQPAGITAVLLLSESHISIHSWPEHGYVAIDVFTCGQTVSPEAAIDHIVEVLKPTKAKVRQIERGDINVK